MKGLTYEMSQHIEIEFKNLLTKSEYERLLKEFKIEKENLFFQENHYFDTREFALKEKGSALRIRKKASCYELTLKQPAPVGLLETNQLLSEAEAMEALHYGKLPLGEITSLLTEADITCSEIKYFGSLATYRAEVKYKNGLLVFDYSKYLKKEDYELEYETDSYVEGERLFKELLQQYQIPKRDTDNKIRRFYNQLYKENSQN